MALIANRDSITSLTGRRANRRTGEPANRIQAYAGFVKLEHTIFSLPLIFAAAILHLRHWPSLHLTIFILLAAASGRVVAMGLNRIIDAQIDARNPRTRQRELPRGAMRVGEAWLIMAVTGALYLASAWLIAPICLRWSPIPVALFVLYPYLKRFTPLAHLGLGLAWSMAPLGGWVAATASDVPSGVEELAAQFHEIAWLWFFSVLWVAGFDIIYATMDEAFDRQAGLHSLPTSLGSRRALRVAALLHLIAFASLWLLWHQQLRTGQAFRWLLAIAALFVWQHAVARTRPAFAFFQLNGVLGFLVLGFVAAGM